MGGVLQGNLNGYGKKINLNLSFDEGIFKDNQLINGTRTDWLNGTVTDGTFENGYLINGKRTIDDYRYEVGTFLKGCLINGERFNRDGVVEVGKFDKGYLINGKIHYLNGEIEIGTFDEDYLVYGKKICISGKILEGEFKDGKLHGEGAIYNKTGSLLYKGNFKRNCMIFGKKYMYGTGGDVIEYDHNNQRITTI